MTKEYYQAHRAERIAYSKRSVAGRREEVRAYQARYRAAHRSKKKAYNRKYQRDRKAVDLNFKLRGALRDRLSQALKGGARAGSAVRDLGCSIVELRAYLETLFQPGMGWDNYGQWQIDHIKPLSKFDLTDRDQVLEVCHFTNLQPLWAKDNLIKGNR